MDVLFCLLNIFLVTPGAWLGTQKPLIVEGGGAACWCLVCAGLEDYYHGILCELDLKQEAVLS